MFARSGTTPFILGQLQAPLDQCGKLFLYGPLLRWTIEVGYREVKQNHAFGRTLSTELGVVYGQLVLSFLAYACLSITRLLTAKLRNETLGWIKRDYFNAIVEVQTTDNGEMTVLFPPWLLDSYGLPEYCI